MAPPRLASWALAALLGSGVAHAQAAAPDPRYAQLPALEWFAVNTNERVTARLYRPDGSLDPVVQQQLSHLLRDTQSNRDCPVIQRTLRLLVRVAAHFSATRIEVISAYRTGRRRDGSREGYHGVGSAVDFRLPGVEPGLVAAYARTLAHVGVGSYPHQGFVHLDSRDQSFFWENANGRGRRRGWDRPVDRAGAQERDRAWTAAEDVPWDPPGATYEHLDATPPTQPGAHHSRSRRSHRGRHRPRPTLHVFQGAG